MHNHREPLVYIGGKELSTPISAALCSTEDPGWRGVTTPPRRHPPRLALHLESGSRFGKSHFEMASSKLAHQRGERPLNRSTSGGGGKG